MLVTILLVICVLDAAAIAVYEYFFAVQNRKITHREKLAKQARRVDRKVARYAARRSSELDLYRRRLERDRDRQLAAMARAMTAAERRGLGR